MQAFVKKLFHYFLFPKSEIPYIFIFPLPLFRLLFMQAFPLNYFLIEIYMISSFSSIIQTFLGISQLYAF